MAIYYSRCSQLVAGLLVGNGGGSVTGLTNTVVQVLSGISGQNTSANIITDIAFNNLANATAFIQFFDVAAVGSVTLGSTSPTASYAIPAGLSGVLQVNQTYSNGIALAATTTATGSSALSSAINVGVAYL
jgi:hypothetical protein